MITSRASVEDFKRLMKMSVLIEGESKGNLKYLLSRNLFKTKGTQ